MRACLRKFEEFELPITASLAHDTRGKCSYEITLAEKKAVAETISMRDGFWALEKIKLSVR